MKFKVSILLVLLGLLVGGGIFWLSPAGRKWRIARTSTADLLLASLSAPQDVEMQKALAKRYVEEGKITEAIGVYTRLTAEAKEDVTLWQEQARLLYIAGNFSEALESVQPLLNRERSTEALCLAGDIQAMLGDKVQAKALYQEALQKEPNREQALAGLSLFATEEHQFSESDALLAKAQNPSSSLFFLAQGFLEEQKGALEKAREAYERSLSRDPNQIRALLLYVALLVRDAHTPNDTQRAEELLKRAESLAPGSRALPYYQALLEIAQKRLPEAEQALSKAIERDPNFTDALFQLSQVQLRLGKTRESDETRTRFERVNDYQREINNLQVRIGRFPTDILLWKQMKGLAEAHQDTPRVRLAEQRLQTLSH